MQNLISKKLKVQDKLSSQGFYFYLLFVSFIWVILLFVPFTIKMSGNMLLVTPIDRTLNKVDVILQPNDVALIGKHQNLHLTVSGNEIPVRLRSILTTQEGVKVTFKPLLSVHNSMFNAVLSSAQSNQSVGLIVSDENILTYLWVKLFYSFFALMN